MNKTIESARHNPGILLEPLLTIADLERILRVSRRTVSRLCKNGKLPRPLKVGGSQRWRARDIAQVLDLSE
jgi:predicted DNA-binding transcriptional regulator AlpA